MALTVVPIFVSPPLRRCTDEEWIEGRCLGRCMIVLLTRSHARRGRTSSLTGESPEQGLKRPQSKEMADPCFLLIGAVRRFSVALRPKGRWHLPPGPV